MAEEKETQLIPVIDISPYFSSNEAARKELAKAIDQACRGVGFFAITNHGVGLAMLETAREKSREFFRLPEPEKLLTPRPAPYILRGYDPILQESLYSTIGIENMVDFKESFTFGNPDIDPEDPYYFTPVATEAGHFVPNAWPNRPKGFREIMEDFYRSMNKLSVDMHHIFALALGLEEDYFDAMIDKPFTMGRIINYPAQPTPPEPNQIRAGEHTDYDNFSFLYTEEDAGGLQVRSRKGEWINVPITKDAFIVNIGDIMMRWTNDIWVSNRHRVINPPRDAATNTDRLSMVFFSEPNYDAVVECLPTCMGPDRPAKYSPISVGDYVKEKFTSQTTFQAWDEEDSERFDTQDTESRFRN